MSDEDGLDSQSYNKNYKVLHMSCSPASGWHVTLRPCTRTRWPKVGMFGSVIFESER